MQTLKARLAMWMDLVAGTGRAIMDPQRTTAQAAAHLLTGLVVAPVALVVILARGR